MACRFAMLLLQWSLVVTWSAARAQPTIKLGSGSVQGLEVQVGNYTVWEFLGIRYGQPPTGPLRFRKPLPAGLPSGLVNATYFGPACHAFIPFIPAEREDEDCLFLNVYVPSNGSGSGSALPVMVWIYGGGFSAGNANSYHGDVLAAEGDVIVVTLNYRLGPFGFLSTGDNASAGNYGLWDQRLALKWIKDNIRHFGGDDTQITLFGESAGGASVSYQAISSHSSGLFHRAILQSGTYKSPWAKVWKSPLTYATRLARDLNCTSASADDSATASVNTQSLVDCLRNKTAGEILNASSFQWTDDALEDVMDFRWLPVADGDFVPPADRISKFPGPLMLGLNNNEGGYLINAILRVADHHPEIWSIYSRQVYLDRYLPFMIRTFFPDKVTNLTTQRMKEAAKLMDCAYRPSQYNESYVAQSELDAVYGDHEFFVGAMQYLQGEPNNDNIYVYLFNHYPQIPGGENGMTHAADLPFTFGFTGPLGQAFGFPDPVSGVDMKMSENLRRLITNFAKTGNPNLPSHPADWPTWLPYTKGDQYYLSLSPTPRVMSSIRADNMVVWLTALPALLETGRVDNKQWNECLGQTSTGNHEDKLSIISLLLVALLQLRHN